MRRDEGDICTAWLLCPVTSAREILISHSTAATSQSAKTSDKYIIKDQTPSK